MKDDKDHIKKNINLESLPKKQVYVVPENYFNELPTIIQTRVVQPEPSSSPILSWSNALRFALPVLTLIMMLVYFGTRINNDDLNVEAMLDDVPTEELVAFLTESDITTEDLLSLIDINELDLDGMLQEDIRLINEDDWDEIMEEYSDLENEI